MLSESALDNILMAQKDNIYQLFNEAVHSPDGVELFNYFDLSARRIKNILSLLKFNQRFWNETSYGYKGLEIVRRIEVVCRNEMDRLHHAATLKRDQLRSAIDECHLLEGHYVSLR